MGDGNNMKKLGNKLWEIIDSYEFVCYTVYVCTTIVLTLFKDIIEFVTNHPPSELIITLMNIINVIFIPLGLVYTTTLIQNRKNLRREISIYFNRVKFAYHDAFDVVTNLQPGFFNALRNIRDNQQLLVLLPIKYHSFCNNQKYIDYLNEHLSKYMNSSQDDNDKEELMEALHAPTLLIIDNLIILKELK